jgi:type II secretory pathway component GspD/PulD (secretin)
MGVLLGATLAPLTVQAAPVVLLTTLAAANVPAQVESRLTKAHNALNAGIEMQRRGEYTNAAAMFNEALARQADLTPEERKDLKNRMEANAAALKARQEAESLYLQADQAYKAGRTSEAETLLKKVIANPSVSAETLKKATQLAGQIRPRGGDAGAPTGTNPLTLARAKVQQARAMLTRVDLDAAEHLALEAQKLNAPFTGTEDTPKKVLDDVSQLRNDPKALLAAARAACERGDYDRAEKYAHMAEKKESVWSMHLRGDSPSKVIKDAQAGRARLAPSGGRPPVVTQKPVDSTNVAQTVVNPPRVDTTAKPTMPAASTPTPASTTQAVPKARPEDVPAMLQEAKRLMAEGKLDDASKVALRAKAAQASRPSSWASSWQLFEDTPEKLIKEIDKAKHQRDQEESVKVLAEGRKLLELGDLEGASKCAYRAEKLHGPYGMMDLCDKPHKLLAEVQAAQEKRRKEGVTATAPASAYAKTEANPSSAQPLATKMSTTPPSAGAIPPLPGISPATPSASAYAKTEANAFSGTPVTAKTSSTPPSTGATTPLPGMSAAPTGRPGDPGPDLGSPFAQAPAKPSPAPMAVNPPATANDANKLRAQGLLADARMLQREGKLIEARQKALECQRLNVLYGPEEDRPEQALVQLAALAGKRIESLMGQAEDCHATAAADPSRYSKCEENLVQARQLAVGFGLDTFRIDAKLGQVRQTIAQAKSSAVASMPPPPVGYQPPPAVGQATATDAGQAAPPLTGIGADLLQRARFELRSGHTEVARRLAEEAFRGNHGVKAEAEAILRDIDREEANQNILTANRTFEAGQQAFNRHDYAQAAAIFRTIDPRLLEPAKQGRLKEYMGIPEMQPRSVQQAVAIGATPAAPGVARTADVGPAPGQPTSPSPEASFSAQVQALRDVRFQELRDRGQTVQRQALELWRTGDTSGALEMLQEHLGSLTLQVGGGQMEPDQVALLRRPIEARLQQLKTLKAQQDFEKEQRGGREAFTANLARTELERQARQKQIGELMKRYNDLYGQAKYDEAEVLALQAHDLDPDNPIVTAAVTMVRMHRNKSEYDQIKYEKSQEWLHQANDSERVGPAVTSNHPLDIDQKVWNNAKKRQPLPDLLIGNKSRAEQEIERRLNGHVSVNFVDKPLKDVLHELQTWHGINIVPDTVAMDEALISLDQPVTIQLDDVSLKSALNLILGNAKLTFVPKDEVVFVTTEKHAKGKMIRKVYHVMDLVVPIQNATMPTGGFDQTGLRSSQMAQANNQNPGRTGVQPYNPQYGLNGGASVGSISTEGSMAQSLNGPMHSEKVQKDNPNNTIQDELISLIKNSIAPTSWDSSGGPATIDYYPLSGALVVNQTPDIQEQIQDLLAALRRLQDQEVAIEVRFITVAESFYERIGLDFNINIKTNEENSRLQPQLTTGQFQTGQQINDFNPSRFISGLTPAGTFTSDLGIPIRTSSFALGIPPFGSFLNSPGGNGGLSLGLAFLSEVQVFMFMEAAQGDQRTHVMQAPKLTLFNGQTAMITVADQQFFTADLNVLIIGTQIAFAPVNTLFPTGGVTMFVQAVISADRRFVRLNITPRLFNLASAIVPLIPVVTPIFPATFEGGQVQNPVVFTQYIQQPTFNTITVMTTVAVPDGGTVLMGGLKRLSEGRNEFGPPVLSKIPYINRLFKNVGYGREVESLLLMVTPRIIIQEEEEERATGFIRVSAGGGQ